MTNVEAVTIVKTAAVSENAGIYSGSVQTNCKREYFLLWIVSGLTKAGFE